MELTVQPGETLTLTTLGPTEQSLKGVFYGLDGGYVQVKLSTALPVGSLTRVELISGDVILGEVVHCSPECVTTIEVEHALFAESVREATRLWNDSSSGDK